MKKKHKKGKRSKKYELFDALCQEMEEKDYHMQDKTFSTKEAGTQECCCQFHLSYWS
ncbi:MAG: hypothetical protein ACLR95_18360 [Enterococcus avium]